MLVAGVAGLVAGAMSMAAGEYVSVSSQSDTERADIERERNELATDGEREAAGLVAAIYVQRGLDAELALPAPTDEALQAVLHKIITRTMKPLTRRGVLVEEEGSTYMADNDGDSEEARSLRPLQAAACTYRIAFGPRAGQKVLTVQGVERGHGTAPAGGPVPREGLALASASAACKACPGMPTSIGICAPTSTVSACTLPCAAAPTMARRWSNCAATSHARRRTEERVQTNAAGQVVLRLKTPWRDGTTHLVMSPLAFMQRLAALVPRPRLHLIRLHGVLASSAKLRAQVVPPR